jgi:hypothetical protein
VSVYVPGHAKRPHDWLDRARAWLSARLPRRQQTELDEDDAWPPDDDEFCPSCGWPDTSAGPCETCGYDQFADVLIDPDCRDGKHQSCVGGPCECDCHEECDHEYTPNEAGTMEWCQKCDSIRPLDVPAAAEPLPGPGYFHDDTPTEVVPAVQLSDGSYAGLSGTIPANLPRPGMEAQGEPAIGPHPDGLRANTGPGQPHRWPMPEPHAGPAAWHPQRTWVTDLVEAALGCADSDAWELRWRWAWQQQRRLAIR